MIHNNIRILTVTTDPNIGGSAKSLINLLSGLIEYDIEVAVVSPHNGYLSNELLKLDITCFYEKHIKVKVWPRLNNIKDLILFIPRFIRDRIYEHLSYSNLLKITQQYKPDIIHSNVSLFDTAYKVAQTLGIKHVWHIREYGDKDFKLYSYPTQKNRIRKLRNTPSISITKGIKSYYNLKNSTVIYNGIMTPSEYINPLNKENYFLFVGGIKPEKGMDELIRAFIEYKQASGIMTLKLVGYCNCEYKHKLEKLLAKSNIQNDVEFLGKQKDISLIMKKAKAIIVPSPFEAFGRVTAEGMMNQCLVIGKNTAGTKEQFDLGKEYTGVEVGLRYETKNQLIEKMLYVDCINDEKYNSILLNAYNYSSHYYSTYNNILNTKKLFDNISNRK